ncbi:LOW QUALITY PROTEIN: hypothetical protein CVT26_012208 [Gymnopilus dilepis]|uniref:Uncharacterized protein n=1 Tax=Gymnopilus dilepis TaxID=231916 RepID=A0A409YQ47_9AGAR|nr:LOW QUALITY PROTEIN: hypothetical protein CVT26_012208 [Gymnopilus dilepis]
MSASILAKDGAYKDDFCRKVGEGYVGSSRHQAAKQGAFYYFIAAIVVLMLLKLCYEEGRSVCRPSVLQYETSYAVLEDVGFGGSTLVNPEFQNSNYHMNVECGLTDVRSFAEILHTLLLLFVVLWICFSVRMLLCTCLLLMPTPAQVTASPRSHSREPAIILPGNAKHIEGDELARRTFRSPRASNFVTGVGRVWDALALNEVGLKLWVSVPDPEKSELGLFRKSIAIQWVQKSGGLSENRLRRARSSSLLVLERFVPRTSLIHDIQIKSLQKQDEGAPKAYWVFTSLSDLHVMRLIHSMLAQVRSFWIFVEIRQGGSASCRAVMNGLTRGRVLHVSLRVLKLGSWDAPPSVQENRHPLRPST